jgi:hypothetical protein
MKAEFYNAGALSMTAFTAKKDRKRLTDLLLAIEARHDVNAIRVDGVHLWPLARLIIGRAFKSTDPSPDKAERGHARQEHRRQLAAEPERRAALLQRQWRAAADLRGTDFVVLSKSEKYYEKKGDKRYAPIVDPVFEDLRERGRAAVLGLEPLPFACVNEPVRIDYEPFLLGRRAAPPRPAAAAVEGLRAIDAFIRATEPDYGFEVEDVLRRYGRIAQRAEFFMRVFEAIGPRCIFLSSFTGWLHAVLAARRLGIPCVDVQHGGQGPMHYPTTHFSRLPADGYEVMPDVFWLWGRMNLDYAAPWLPGSATRHVPVVGGNRKVAHWYRRRDAGALDAVDRAYLERFAGRPVVLVTLSYAVDQLIPGALIEAMRACGDFEWHVRLHPIHRTAETAAQVRAALAGCASVHIDEPSAVQLPTALSASVAHITPFSTAGIEAVAMGVPTLVAHRIGARLFQEEIDAGVLAFADDAAGIERWVRAAGAAGIEPEARRRYVETDDAAVDRVLETALALRGRAPLARRVRSWFSRQASG